jgi:formylglycine-generating enzyme required for sulfatase activity
MFSTRKKSKSTAKSAQGRTPFTPKATGDAAYSRIFQGDQASERAQGVRLALHRALEAWWRQGQIPALGLLRDGLLILEAGHDLDEPVRTLLLRTALFYGRGMLTALRHQPDDDRIAAVMVDMLLHVPRPLSPAQISHLRQQDENSNRWFPALIALLSEEEQHGLEPRRTLAAAARLYLNDAQATTATWTPPAHYGSNTSSQLLRPTPRRSHQKSRSIATGLGIVALLMLITSVVLLWQDVQQTNALTGGMRTVPSGTYLISDPADWQQDRLVELGAFAMDRTEVTNAAYRNCYDAGACSLPTRVASVNRPDYFFDSAQGGFPMINVTWSQADTFCRWVGKRLPLTEEWEVAAGSALTLRQRYLFPWGDVFDVNLANGALSATQDTRPTGSYSPAGDSPAGLADMAGNVAEWTATPSDPDIGPETGEERSEAYIVKGGSFLSPPEEMLVSARAAVDSDEYYPWLGFRCAVTLPARE